MGDIPGRQIAIRGSSAAGLLLVGGLATLEFAPLNEIIGVLLIGALLYSLAAFYSLTATPQNAVLFIACLSAVGIVAIPNFGAPLMLKLSWPVMCLPLALVAVLRDCGVRKHLSLPTKFVLTFQGYTLGSAVLFNSSAHIKESGLRILTILPLIIVLSRIAVPKFQSFMLFVAGLACLQAALAVLEVTGVATPVWGLLGGAVPEWGLENHLLPNTTVRGMGTLAHPIPLGMLCAFGALFLLASRKLHPWLTGLLIFILFCGVIASGTRSALVALVVIVGGMYLTRRGRVDSTKLALGALACCILAFAVDVAALFGAGDLPSSVSYTHRMQALTVLPAILNSDLVRLITGTNPRSLLDISSLNYLQSSGIEAIDNQWISVLIDYGLVGSILLVGAVVSLFWSRSWDRRIAALAFVLSTWSFDVMAWHVGLLMVLIVSHQAFGRPHPEQLTTPTRSLSLQGGRHEFA